MGIPNDENLFDFEALYGAACLRDAALNGTRIILKYPTRGVPLTYRTLDDMSELPGYSGEPPTGDSACDCLGCVFIHSKFGVGRN